MVPVSNHQASINMMLSKRVLMLKFTHKTISWNTLHYNASIHPIHHHATRVTKRSIYIAPAPFLKFLLKIQHIKLSSQSSVFSKILQMHATNK